MGWITWNFCPKDIANCGHLVCLMLNTALYFQRGTCRSISGQFTVHTDDVTAEVNTNVNLTCRYSPENVSMNVTQWYYGIDDPTDRIYRFVPGRNQRIAYKHMLGRSLFYHSPGVAILSIRRANETDDGKYKCELENEENAHATILDFRTNYQATITAPKHGTVFDRKMGDTVRITITSNCTKPPVEISWSSTEGANTTYVMCSSNQYATTTISTFTASSVSESFRLIMTATHPSFPEERESREYVVRVPDLFISGNSAVGSIGKDISIACMALPLGTVPSVTKWYYIEGNVKYQVLVYDTQIGPNGTGYHHLKERASHTLAAGYSSLTINKLAKSDEGIYECEVWVRDIPYPRASLNLLTYGCSDMTEAATTRLDLPEATSTGLDLPEATSLVFDFPETTSAVLDLATNSTQPGPSVTSPTNLKPETSMTINKKTFIIISSLMIAVMYAIIITRGIYKIYRFCKKKKPEENKGSPTADSRL